MQLQHTNALLKEMLEGKRFDSYAVTVGMGTDMARLTSDNVNGDTLFDMASIGKILHTVPVLFQLIDEGRLTLDSTLGQFFPYIPEEKKNVTVRQLLTHSSGVIRTEMTKEQCNQGTEHLVKEILKAPLAFAPGTSVQYSCAGMNLLALIEEQLTGKLMEELFMERIRKPLGMVRSKFALAPDEENAAVCHRWPDAYPQQFDDPNVLAMGRVCGAGGSFFSPDDLVLYCRAVLDKNEKLYSKRFFDEAEKVWSPRYTPDGKLTEASRGLGFQIVDAYYKQTGELFPVGSFGHCGHTGQSIYFNREMNLFVIINTNATRFTRIHRNFVHEDYDSVCKMREEIHNAIRLDLAEDHLIPG